MTHPPSNAVDASSPVQLQVHTPLRQLEEQQEEVEEEIIIRPSNRVTVSSAAATTLSPTQTWTIRNGLAHHPRRRLISSLRASNRNLIVTSTPPTQTGNPEQMLNVGYPSRPPWAPTADEDARYRAQRRSELLSEISKKQQSSCKFFLVMSLAPFILLLIRMAAPITEDIGEYACRSKSGLMQVHGLNITMSCAPERKHFINAFSSRCLCSAITNIVDGSNNTLTFNPNNYN